MHFGTHRRKLLHQRRAIDAQRIHAHGERRTRIVAATERLRPLVSVDTHPPLHHPLRMPCAQRECACISSVGEFRALWLSESCTQDTIDEGVCTPAPVFFRQFHRRIACGGRRHAIHEENLIKAKTQKLTNGRLCLSDVGNIAPDHIVERFPRLCNTVNKLCQKAAVTFRQPHLAQRFRKRHIRVCTLRMHLLEHLHRQLTHMVDLFLSVLLLHHAPFLVSSDAGSMISSSWRRTSFMSTLVL